MNIKKIAGVSVDLDKKSELDLNQLIKMAVKTKGYINKKGAEELVKSEFKKHGISKGNIKKSSKSEHVREVRQPYIREKGLNNFESTESMEEGYTS